VTYGEKVESLSDLKGQEIYLPFEGSPIEEATMFLAKQEGLVWGTDLKPVYSPFDASVALLKEGKAKAVVLPEPFVTLVEKEPNLFISLDYFASLERGRRNPGGLSPGGRFRQRRMGPAAPRRSWPLSTLPWPMRSSSFRKTLKKRLPRSKISSNCPKLFCCAPSSARSSPS
jgi:hypothetical protein